MFEEERKDVTKMSDEKMQLQDITSSSHNFTFEDIQQ